MPGLPLSPNFRRVVQYIAFALVHVGQNIRFDKGKRSVSSQDLVSGYVCKTTSAKAFKHPSLQSFEEERTTTATYDV